MKRIVMAAACLTAAAVLAVVARAFLQDDSCEKVARNLAEGRIAEALELARGLASVAPLDAQSQALLGLALWRWGDYGQAGEWIETALDLDGECPEAHLAMAEVAASKHRYESALAHLQAAKVSRCMAGEAFLLLGSLQEDLGNPSAALGALESARGLIEYHPLEIRANLEASIAFLRAAGEGGFYEIPVPFQRTTVDLTERGDHVGIRLEINGVDAGVFLVDTGASGDLVISPALAGDLGLEPAGGFTIRGLGGGGKVEGGAALLRGVRIGRLEISGVPARVLASRRLRGDVKGIVGRSVLHLFNFSIDYPGKTLSLVRFDRPGLHRSAINPAGIVARVPLYYADLALVAVDLGNAERVPAALDTGSSMTLIDEAYFNEHLRGSAGIDFLQEIELQGVGGAATGRRFALRSLRLDGFDLGKAEIVAVDLKPVFANLGRRVVAVLGADLLGRFKLHFDLSASELVLERADAGK